MSPAKLRWKAMCPNPIRDRAETPSSVWRIGFDRYGRGALSVSVIQQGKCRLHFIVARLDSGPGRPPRVLAREMRALADSYEADPESFAALIAAEDARLGELVRQYRAPEVL